MAKKKVLAVDIDEVLAHHNQALVDHYNELYGTNHTVDGYMEDWAIWWDVDYDEAERRAAVFHKSKQYVDMQPVKGAVEALAELEKQYKLIIVTGRSRERAEYTHEWLDRHFPKVFHDAHFIGLWHEGRGKTKAEVCIKIGADILIDDSVDQAIACANAGIRVLLFGNYSWNQADELPEPIERVMNWQEVLNKLLTK